MDTSTIIPESMIERLGHLLAESPIDTVIKEAIISNLDTIPAYLLVGLLDALEAERESLKILDADIKKFDTDREKRIDDISPESGHIVQGLAERWAQKIATEYAARQ